jgi:predicted short-subunit dehydrogenase-like oxidoreductase (DUF2520 family)
MTDIKNKKISIIGVGRVGSALFHKLIKHGHKISYAVDSNLPRLKKITSINKKIKLSQKINEECLRNSDVVIFAVQEKKLTKAISECRKYKLDLTEKILFHLSGIETSALLDFPEVDKSNTGSFHPLQTFNDISYKYSNILNEIYFGIEGGTAALEYFKKICKEFKSNYLVLPKDKKILYHAACVIASNFMVSHFNIISGIVKELSAKNERGVEIFKPIVMTTLNNIFTQGIGKSLTGPFERGDVSTINLHLKYFKENLPSYLYYYILSGIEAMNLAIRKKSITKKEAKEIEVLLFKYIY